MVHNDFPGSRTKLREEESTKAPVSNQHVGKLLLQGHLNRGLVSEGHPDQLGSCKPRILFEATPGFSSSQSQFE